MPTYLAGHSLSGLEAGLTLAWQQYDADGTAAGLASTAGFVEHGDGFYSWLGEIESGSTGSIRFTEYGVPGIVLASVAIAELDVVTTDAASRNASKATGFSTPLDVTNAAGAIITHGDTSWITASGYSTITTQDIDNRLAAWGKDNFTLTSDYDAAKTAAQAGDVMEITDARLDDIKNQTDKLQFTGDNLVRARKDVITGLVYVNHNYGGENELRVLDTNGIPQTGVIIRAFRAEDWSNNKRSNAYVIGEDITADGYWTDGIYMPVGDIVLVLIKPGHYTKARTITVS